MGRPNQTHERLDALLDGRPGEVTDDLAPLLEAAESLRAELAQFELDPDVADRHLERVLNGSAPVVALPVRQRVSMRQRVAAVTRRRVAAVALAAALVLVPATTASAASSDALPGQALYAVKLAVEQVRLAGVQWSATREAAERTRQAGTRLQELNKLVQLRIFRQVPPAIRRLDQAVVAAREAVEEAAKEGPDPKLAAVAVKLEALGIAQHVKLKDLQRMVAALPSAEAKKIAAAVKQSPALAKPIASPALPPAAPSVATTGPPLAELPPASAPPAGSTPTPEPPPPAPPVTTAPPPPVTEPPPPPVTEPEVSTTEPPPASPTTTTAPAPPEDGSSAGQSETGPTPTTGP